MGQPFQDITVAITEHRYSREFASLFERLGATVFACPVLEETAVENHDELQEFIRGICAQRQDMVIFLTGVGAKFLISEAESLGIRREFLNALEFAAADSAPVLLTCVDPLDRARPCFELGKNYVLTVATAVPGNAVVGLPTEYPFRILRKSRALGFAIGTLLVAAFLYISPSGK